jgi:DeoR/GlpR family transcriptional regulator of sugar metabolism
MWKKFLYCDNHNMVDFHQKMFECSQYEIIMKAKMSKEDRHRRILDLLDQHRFITINQVCESLGVSEMTVRRDLNFLSERDHLTRVSGGAISSDKQAFEPTFHQRARLQATQKKLIARKAMTLIDNGEVIGLGVGSTTMELVKQFKVGQAITVVTNWIPSTLEIAGKKQIRVFLLGGMVRSGEFSVGGDSVARAIADFQIDKYFFSVSGIDLERGLVDYESGEVQAMPLFIKHAREAIVLVDSYKVGRAAPSTVGPVSLVQKVITDDGVSQKHRSFLQEQGVELLIAK